MPNQTPTFEGTPAVAICVICGTAMPAKRALVCSKSCAAEQSLIRSIIEGRDKRRYGCMWDYMRRKARSRSVRAESPSG
jgi:hypothetical protein